MKEKISISLDSGTIASLDQSIDNKLIRNRSQAVEFVLAQYFDSKAPLKAVLLGGKLEESAKLLNLNKILDELAQAGVTELIVAGGKATERIFSEIQKHPFYSKKCMYLREDAPLGTAGAVKLAANYLQHAFIVTYLDVEFSMDLAKMVAFHKKSRGPATMAVTYVEGNNLTDYIRISGENISEFEYKSGRTTKLQNAAVYVFEPSILEELPSKGGLEKELFPQLAKEGKLRGFMFDTKWKHLEK
ncbi:MAG: hypothetical protein J4215_02190 [Candidatus Diapherotrites archaeon]|uniref:Nucleotidyl transferase domain-containing protein n=1 Tax=Candidatus Iainarchaeum sp. TaxID=3101447 RepID=A0A8T4L754_9ARCH|nr:hypothetical protein [Candidatus Diapherotrites archaeon]